MSRQHPPDSPMPMELPSRHAARLAGVTKEALLAARDRGELVPREWGGELWWFSGAVQAWADPTAVQARKDRRVTARAQARARRGGGA